MQRGQCPINNGTLKKFVRQVQRYVCVNLSEFLSVRCVKNVHLTHIFYINLPFLYFDRNVGFSHFLFLKIEETTSRMNEVLGRPRPHFVEKEHL